MRDLYRTFLELLGRYGRTVTLRKGTERHLCAAYIAPFNHENRQYLDDKYSTLGYRDQNAFLYIGSPEGAGASLAVGDLVLDCGEWFIVSVCEMMRMGDQPFYMWGILRRAHPEDEEGTR
ncbi:hypothetical protein [Ligaoa zhengdingensis]|uniref:hypothetical protein n=1 Tax=Ligaoa zhengdingensis TaxID=2763658 RepID=UPI0031BB3787